MLSNAVSNLIALGWMWGACSSASIVYVRVAHRQTLEQKRILNLTEGVGRQGRLRDGGINPSIS